MRPRRRVSKTVDGWMHLIRHEKKKTLWHWIHSNSGRWFSAWPRLVGESTMEFGDVCDRGGIVAC